MNYVSEYRDAKLVRDVLGQIAEVVTQPWTLMEVCGGQTHSIIRYGLDQLLPKGITLLHGPGCPVCVTPLAMIDKALVLARLPNVILTSYGDMLRVPGSAICKTDQGEARDLYAVKGSGGDVRVVYSPLEAVAIARENPKQQVVFFAIGFETTAPANGQAVLQAHKEKLENFSVLVSHVTVPPAICEIMNNPNCQVNGFLAAGHVCTVMGVGEYLHLAQRYHIPIVVTGFEPLDLVYGVLKVVKQLEAGEYAVENAYRRTSPDRGNRIAQQVIQQVFEVCDRDWRGIGRIAKSGYRLRPEFAQFDAEKLFGDVAISQAEEPVICRSGEVLQGQIRPNACPAFASLCTPANPLGATMVSGEGACAAYYKYGRSKL